MQDDWHAVAPFRIGLDFESGNFISEQRLQIGRQAVELIRVFQCRADVIEDLLGLFAAPGIGVGGDEGLDFRSQSQIEVGLADLVEVARRTCSRRAWLLEQTEPLANHFCPNSIPQNLISS